MNQRVDKKACLQTNQREALIQPSFESYRVVLLGVGKDSEEEKAVFCHQVSEKLGFPHRLLQKIVDRCPMVLKRELTQKRAKSLAGILASFGARVSIEAKRVNPPILLEFQGKGQPQVSLETAILRKTSSGMWSVMGRVKNIIGLPADIIKDCRKALSNIGPKTKASTSGAGS